MNIEIPKEIKYLEPFISYLEKLDPNEIDDSVDTTKLIAGINKRLNKLSISKSLSILNNDVCILNEWIDKKSNPHPAVFITSFVQIDEDFINFIKKQNLQKQSKNIKKTKNIKFTADTPDGFEVEKHKDSILFTKSSDNFMTCSIFLQLLNNKLIKSLELIKQNTTPTIITDGVTEIERFELGGRKIYQFNKNNTPFSLSIESKKPIKSDSYAFQIIGSLVVYN